MTGVKLIGLGVLIALLLPAVIAAADNRKLPDGFTFVLAAAGLAYTGFAAGLGRMSLHLLTAVLILVALAALLALTQRRAGRRLLSGADLKLLAAGACWLGPPATIAMMLIVSTLTIAASFALQHIDPKWRWFNLMVISAPIIALSFAVR